MNRSLIAVLAALACAGCAGFGRFSSDQGEFVWADDLAAESPAEEEYVLGPGDVVQIRVFNQDNLTFKTRVRRDGRITLPLVAEVEATGLTPKGLGAQLQVRLKEFINAPVVTVSLEEPRQLQVSILGEITRPGVYALETGAGILQALAVCGGVTEFAHRDRVYVVRASGTPARIRFDLEKVVRKGGRPLRFRLQPGDAVVVE